MTILPENSYAHCFKLFGKFNNREIIKLLDNNNQKFSLAYYCPINRIINLGINQKSAHEFINFKEQTSVEQEWAKLTTHNIEIISYQEQNYPTLLKTLTSPPPILYYRGSLPNPESLCLSIVGSRKMSTYGESATKQLISELKGSGITIISGLAYGIDGTSHEAALKNKLNTVAVVATGLLDEDIYPQAHLNLSKEIINSGGALLSEYPPETPALKQNFIARNLIIAGLSVGTLVIEGEIKSGALITAKFALEQNRSVFALPGSIFSLNSAGPNWLISQGAKLTSSANDLAEELNINLESKHMGTKNLSPIESEIIRALTLEELSASELSQKINIESSIINSTLTYLELKGLVKLQANQKYILLKI